MMQSTRRGILEYLRDRGSGTVDALSEASDLAPVTVRHHLGVLRRRGLVQADTESVGRGRPRYVFWLSPEGAQALMEDGYQALASRLLHAMKAADGRQVERFFRDMAGEIAETNLRAFDGQSMDSRLDALVSMLSAAGFTARWERDGDGYVVHQIGCPYHELSAEHAEVCLMDFELIGRVTGRRVRRESWRRAGDDVCVIRVGTADGKPH